MPDVFQHCYRASWKAMLHVLSPKLKPWEHTKKCVIFSAGRSIVFAVSICSNTTLKQTDRTRWTIQTHSADELNWARRRIFYELNSLSLFRLMKTSTFGLGLRGLNHLEIASSPLQRWAPFLNSVLHQLNRLICLILSLIIHFISS